MSPAAPPSAPAEKSSRWWILVIVLTVFAAAVGLPSLLYNRDASPPDDADLRVPAPIVPDEHNGLRVFQHIQKNDLDFLLFAEKREVADVMAQEIFSGARMDEKLIAEYLAQAQPILTQIEAAISAQDFEFSLSLKTDMYLPEISPLLSGGKAILMEARLAKLRGEEVVALAKIGLARALARRLAGCHGGVIHVLTANAIDHLVCAEAVRWLNDPKTKPATLDALAAEFRREINWSAGFAQAFRIEYQYFLICLDAAKAHHGLLGKLANQKEDNWAFRLLESNIRPNETRRLAAAAYRADIAATGLSYRALQQQMPPESFEPASLWKFILPNGGGRYLLPLLMVDGNSLLATKCNMEAFHHLTQVGVALRQYYDDHHALPAKLEELVPQYLPEVPSDPYDGQLLRYDAGRGLVYSVGQLLKDNGGSKYLNSAVADPDKTPLTDNDQPTLELTFQKSPAAVAGESKSAN